MTIESLPPKTAISQAIEKILTTPPKESHPEGQKESFTVETFGPTLDVQFDEGTRTTANGQLAFFSEFLKVSEVFKSWVENCPLNFKSPNASNIHDVLATLMWTILSGGRRYAHVAAVRGDKTAAEYLGATKLVSADTVRRALGAIDPDAGAKWLCEALKTSVQPALGEGYVLDLDVTIKPLYGHQEGAEIGYNPHKPGRACQAIHTFLIGLMRLVIDSVVLPGKKHSSSHGIEALERVLSDLGPQAQPTLIRGDCGYGNEDMLKFCEQRNQKYLFRLRQTPTIKKLIERLMGGNLLVPSPNSPQLVPMSVNGSSDAWEHAVPAGAGYWAIDVGMVRLQGWSQARRAILMRRPAAPKDKSNKKHDDRQLLLPFETVLMDQTEKRWEYMILVTNVEVDISAIGQLYRDRCDCENAFDELKNQWGWAGFSTQDLHRTQLTARVVAWVHNLWTWYARAAVPEKRMEAITSRPKLLSGIGRESTHAGQRVLMLTLTYETPKLIKRMIVNIQEAISHVRATAQQFPKANPWASMVHYILGKILKKSAENRALTLQSG